MKHKNFSEVLNDFMSITEIKMKDLAVYLDYDISYINKWVNGKNIPSQKIAEAILESLALFFGKKIYDDSLEEQLVEISERKVNAKSLESVISITRSILIDGFYASQASFEEETDIQKLVYTETLTDLHEIMQRAFTEIEKAISLAEEEVNIYITLDLYQLFRKIFAAEEIFYVTRGVKVNIYWLMEKDAIIFNTGLENELYYLMGKCSYFNTYIYLTDKIYTRPYILIDEKLVMNFIANLDKEIVFMNLSNEKHVLAEFKKMNKKLFTDQQLIFYATDNEALEFDIIMESIALEDNRFIMHGVFPEGYFLTEEVLKDVIIRYKLTQNLLKLRRAIETVVKDYSIVLLISKKALIQFMPKMQICLGPHVFQLTPEELKKCEKNRDRIISQNPNVKFGIIEDEIYPYKLFDQGITVSCSQNHVWFKKNPILLDGYVKPYYTICSQEIVDIVGNFTEGLNYNNNFFHWIDYESYRLLIDGIIASSNDTEN